MSTPFARDDNGNLKVMYRGDNNVVFEFDRKKSKSSNRSYLSEFYNFSTFNTFGLCMRNFKGIIAILHKAHGIIVARNNAMVEIFNFICNSVFLQILRELFGSKRINGKNNRRFA